MNFKRLIFIALVLGLSGCASSPVHTEQPVVAKKKVKAVASLEKMDVQFLYLAYRQAVEDGQYPLAASFLQALIKKEPSALVPKLELVDLYLVSGKGPQAKAARQVMASISESTVNHMQAEALVSYQLLYARTWVANGEVEKASDLLLALLNTQPKNIQVRLLLMRMYVLQGDIKSAHGVLKEGLKVQPDPRLQQAQVQLFLQQKNTKAADEILARMQKKYPEHEDVVLQRSQLAEQQGDAKKAERLLKAYIDKHGASAGESFLMLADLYVRQERLQDAIVMYRHNLQLTANTGTVYMSLGKVYYQMTAYDEASKMFAQAVKQFLKQNTGATVADAGVTDAAVTDGQATAYFYLAASLEAAKNWKKAVPNYEKILPKHTFYLDAQLRLASIEVAREAYKAAEKRIKGLLNTFKGNLDVYELLSDLRLRQKDYKGLISDTKPSLNHGFSKVILFNRAVAFESLKQFSKLDAVLDQLLNKDSNQAEVLNFYGYSLADRGVRLGDALAMINKALKLKPEDGYYLDSLAWVYFKQGKYKKAVEVQRQAIVIVADDPVMQEHLGDMYWKANEQGNAKKHWERALELHHESPDKLKVKIEHGLL